MEKVVHVSVGGVYFTTRRSTLADSSSFFSRLLSGQPDAHEVFVDRDPAHFRHILNWMRGVRFLPEEDVVLRELAWEADYYGLTDMREAITRAKTHHSAPHSLHLLHASVQRLAEKGRSGI